MHNPGSVGDGELPTLLVRPPDEPDERRGPRRRLTAAHVAAAVLFAAAGAMFAAGATASQDGALRDDRTGGLRYSIAQRAEENVEMQVRVDALDTQLATLTALSDLEPTLAQTGEQINQMASTVALTTLRGPGITVVLEDAPTPETIPPPLTGDDYIVHQEDIEGVVNALWRGGASGVAVMGQRLIATSAVRCVGNTVILQGRVHSPPFVIEAVGDTAAMAASLEADPAVTRYRDWAGEVGLRYDQIEAAELVLPAYTGPISATEAQVIS